MTLLRRLSTWLGRSGKHRAERSAVVEEVEPRILYSADLNPALWAADAAAAASAIVGAVDPAPQPSATASTTQQQQQRHEIVFVDAAVPDAQALIDGVLAARPAGTTIEVVQLSSGSDGLKQISDVLIGERDLDAIHIISHGGAGQLQLGSSTIDTASLQDRTVELQGWRAALTGDADLMLYGCDVAADTSGREFVNRLAALTGADVAASTDLTGRAAKGGDWRLEFATGAIETATAVDAQTQQQWDQVLAITTGNSTSAGTGASTSASSLTWSHTVGSGSNGILIVSIATRDSAGGTVSSITYGGTALTFIGADTSSKTHAELWYLKAPATGTANIVVNLTSAENFVAGATNFFGVNQTTPYGSVTTGNGSGDPSLIVASATGELVVDAVADRDVDSETIGAGQTALWVTKNGTGSNDAWGGSSSEAGAASVTMSWTTTGAGAGEWAAVAVSLKAAPAAPVVATTGTTLAYTENGSATVVDSGLTVSDVDSTNLTGATLTISTDYANGQDVLAFTNQLGITGSWNAGTGVLTLSGTTTVANYQTALRAVTYVNSSDNPSTTTRTVSFVVNDGSANSNTGTRNISVAAVNDPPVATITPATYAATEQVALTLKNTGLSISDVDAAAGSMTVTLSVTEGTLTVTAGGSGALVSNSGTSSVTITGTLTQINNLLGTDGTSAVSYTNGLDAPSASATLTLLVNDNGNTGGGSLTNSDTATINITAVNDAPTLTATALNPSFTEAAGLGTQAAAVSVFSAAAASTIESGQTITGLTFTVSGLVDGANEVIVVDGRTITLGANSSGTTVTNGLAYSSTLSGATATVVLSSGSLSTAATQTLVNGITYQNTRTDNPTPGNRVITLTQIKDSGGTANGGADTTTLAIGSTVAVSAVNDPPAIGDATVAIDENSANATAVTNVSESFTGTDFDRDAQAITYSITGGNTGGAFAINASTGAITVANSAALDFETTPSFTLTVTASDGTLSDTGSITVNLNNLNDNAPNIVDATVAIDENSANATAVINVSDSFTGTDFDRDAQTITYSITAGNTGGAFAINAATGAITVANSAALDFETTPSFTLTVTASDGTLSDTAAITVNLNNLNDNAPAIADATVAIDENSANATAVTNVSDSFTGTDFDRDAQAITYSITGGNTGGAFVIDAATGAITVANSAALDFETAPSFTLTVTASDGSLSDTAAITVNLNNLNDNAPNIVDATVAIDENSANATAVLNVSDSFTGTDLDRDGEAITYSISAGNTGGAFAIDAATGAITVANSAALDFEASPSFTLTVTASDGSLSDTAAITVNLNNLNDNAPNIIDATVAIDENSANAAAVTNVSDSFTGTDFDRDAQAITYSITAGNTGGAFAIDAVTGAITVANSTALDFETTPSFTLTVTASDGSLSDTAAITVNLNNLNDNAPAIADATVAIDEAVPTPLR